MFLLQKIKDSITLESYKTLRTNLEHLVIESKKRTILVTSSNTKEGKSTICENIALSFSQNNKKVLLIDCDLRKLSSYKHFSKGKDYGLSDVLLGEKKINDIINHYNESLDIIFSGKTPQNPVELLSSNAMDTLLNQLKNLYDLIIIDSPSLKLVTDALVLADKSDGVLFVVNKEVTNKNSAKQAKKLLDNVDANIIGCVLNAAERPSIKEYKSYFNKKIN
ncbi:CpsD/CapB family tyrosine-protein kinase [uncultured Clostridium sp.]|uniref:CpsD/CapB family tyrosine-protein kinase n=1 Tax=uncultured Clostridium sp. TaxID=59620 RepID=UPI0025F92409|nr:CpsD/CapB family tyrosine-protein kinase [uncultured Clostridium sp.]